MKRVILIIPTFVITTVFSSSIGFAKSDEALDEIVAKYKACIKTELEASDNGDGTYDEVFFLEGKEHCDKIKGLRERTAASKARMAQMTADLIAGAKSELGLK